MPPKRYAIIVSHILPLPATQGNRRAICQLIGWLRKQDYHVAYVAQVHAIAPQQRAEMADLVDELHIAKDEPGAVAMRTRLQGLEKKGFGWPLKFWFKRRSARQCWPETIRIVRKLAAKRQTVAIVAEYYFMTACFDGLPDSILTLTQTIDVHSRIGRDVAGKGADTSGRECSPRAERRALERGKVIIAIQEEEARQFRELAPSRETLVLGFAADAMVKAPNPQPNPGEIVMVGSGNPLNRKGLQDFCYKAWPRILQQIPEATLRVAGGVCEALPRETPNAQALGIVDNLEEAYHSASVVINPVDSGTGLKIKSVEALCWAKALVSTSPGVEGIVHNAPAPFCVADDWGEFAAQTARLLRHDDARREMETRALTYAKEQLSEAVVFNELQSRLDKHIAQFKL